LFSNTLLNALQHSPDGAAVQIVLKVGESKAWITVRDHGEGISEKAQAHIFEPFYRGDPSRSRKSGGTGLGLSICKAICERAGGSIEIVNNHGGGALVTITLPAEPLPSALQASSVSLKAQ
jgi:signal transduction histidine kinase